MISFDPLHRLMEDRAIPWTELRERLPCSSGTAAKLHAGHPVSLDVIDKVCRALGCRVEDVIEYRGD